MEQMLSEGLSLAEIGRRSGLHESTVGYWVAKHGLEAVGRSKHAARGGIARDELERLVGEGMSITQIADSVGRSKATVRHWLRGHGLKTRRSEDRRALAEKATSESDLLIRTCALHGQTTFKRRSPSGYRCLKCRSEAVSLRRRRIKRILVEEAGGACRVCGYARCMAALEFHHLAPAEKAFSLSEEGVTRSLARARQEAEKCVLLCANCHAEVEAGMTALTEQDSARVQWRAEAPDLDPG